MECTESIKQRLTNCEQTIELLEEIGAPRQLIESNEEMRLLIKGQLKRSQKRELDKANEALVLQEVNAMSQCRDMHFAPATLGGLGGYITTEKGLFFVFSITGNVSELEFDYSQTGKEENLVKGYEIDIDYGDGFYNELKPHVEEVVQELGLDKHASKLLKQFWEE